MLHCWSSLFTLHDIFYYLAPQVLIVGLVKVPRQLHHFLKNWEPRVNFLVKKRLRMFCAAHHDEVSEQFARVDPVIGLKGCLQLLIDVQHHFADQVPLPDPRVLLRHQQQQDPLLDHPRPRLRPLPGL